MHDPRAAAQQLMRVARMFELNGDAVTAICVYREVILAGEETTSADAVSRGSRRTRRSESDSTSTRRCRSACST